MSFEGAGVGRNVGVASGPRDPLRRGRASGLSGDRLDQREATWSTTSTQSTLVH
jgi:hypothetical protein